jgi:hypothetical protein
MKTLINNGHARGVDQERHTATAVISTGNVARDGAMINPDGWNFDAYLKNPVVLFPAHDVAKLPVGRCIDLQSINGELIATCEFDMENEQAAEVFNAIARGFLRATSVRWIPTKTSVKRVNGKDVLYFENQSLVEWSWATVGIDENSLLIRSADGDELQIADFVDANTAAVEAATNDVLTSESKATEAAKVAEAASARLSRIMSVASLLAANDCS